MYTTYQQQQQQQQYHQHHQQQQRKQVQHYMHQTSTMPIISIRPRSSLTIDENCCRFKDLQKVHKKNNHRVILTLAGFCIFLLILCIFLLATLVYVGKTIVHQKKENQPQQVKSRNLSSLSNINDKVYAEEHLTTKSIKHFLPVLSAVESSVAVVKSTISSTDLEKKSYAMNASNILKHLTYRLPKELKPLYYKLKLHPDLTNKTFRGDIHIELQILKPIAFIPVHAKNLQVITENVYQLDKYGAEKCNVTPVLTFMHPVYEYWITEFSDDLEIGNYSLRLTFEGSLTNKIVGLYQSSYWDEVTKNKRWIATTKFEPTYARQAFPCFDEPHLKAKFSVTILKPTDKSYHALSNMNIHSEIDLPNGMTEVHFAESVPMSTYLVCFIVSDFAFKSKTVKGSILSNATDFEMRVYSTTAQLDKLEYALNVGVAITEFYIKYFNISYPLSKLDMVAIPDFASGAMENWGLVTYRETSLLYDPKISSSINKQRVATVIAHELAHMWFGNLVTMKWWNDLWLNEGFARYIEFKGVHHVHPDWNMPGQFLIKALHDVMNLDATLATHPIVQVVEKPNQITELFDSITYAKGGSVIRMLEDLVGPEKFQNATTNYLNRYIYSNAETNDFLNEIEGLASDFDVKLIMQTWTQQSGYPMVTVTRDNSTLKLTQKRFFANPDDYNQTLNDSQFNYHWSIPITYFTDQDLTVQRTLFNYNDNEVRIVIPSNVNWIKFNKDQIGFYRVNYPADIWQALTFALTHSMQNFSSADRAHLISDAFALAKANQLNYSIALNLSKYLTNEEDYIPLSVGLNCLTHIKNILYYTDTYAQFRIYVRQLLENVYNKVTWHVGQNHLENLLRQAILSAACAFGHTEALNEARKRFLNWLENPADRPHPDIRSTIYYYGMQEAGNEQLWQQVWQLFIKEQNAQEKLKLMKSLAAIKQPWLLQRYINLAWDETHIRSQDYFECLINIARNPLGENLVWDYVRDNWPKLVERFTISDRSLGRMLPSITAHFASQSKLNDMERFFEKYPEGGAGTAARKEAIENVKNNIKWLQEHLINVTKWLEQQKFEQ